MHHETASIPTPAGEVEGTLDLPTGATGVVLFAMAAAAAASVRAIISLPAPCALPASALC